MKERPIIFSAPMVHAILAGTKTQTRRVAKLTPGGHVKEPRGHRRWHPGDPDAPAASPFGAPGDRLWVRETWRYTGSSWCSERPDEQRVFIEYQADGAKLEYLREHGDQSGIPQQRCRCTGEGDEFDQHMEHQVELERYWKAIRSPIHMPRWASRITLEVTDVRVERLQEISGEDARAEGISFPQCGCEVCAHSLQLCPTDASSHVEEFGHLWESIHGPGSWDASPWVWVVSFKPKSRDGGAR